MTIMSSYFRNWFGGSSTTSSSSKPRSRSSGPAPIYAPASASSANADVQRSYSFSASRATNPSPLRYATGTDTRTMHGYAKRSAASPYAEPRANSLRRASYKTREPVHYSSYASSGGHSTPPHSRSNSSTSLFGMGVPRSSGSDAGHHYAGHSSGEIRPPLRQNQSWQSVGTASSYGSGRGGPSSTQSHSSSYSRPRTPMLHMHPLLAYTRLHHAPLTYDVTFTPSARTVLDRATHSAIPSHTLAQPATEPPMPSGARLVLRSSKFPWPVIVSAPSATASPGPRFTVGPPKTGTITNLDVLYAVHTTLMTPVTPEEWAALGNGSRAQHKVAKAYERRCTRMGGGWEAGVRRVDWLGEKTRLVGVEVDKSGGGGGTGKLIFEKP
ncbi:hypothetical protein FOMPIDRAFT_1031584 [Fomitopsis schrenkii]|uniref:DUF6699 domain-containing protein n=1 Tax=Fomitopsis schrenkii TaxID=2126942 RepID=S8DZ76_FOMSC|nr:hypothetical protein FOMPIDRAFT_1031584 [Fomitopsis schrenkii]